MNKQKFFHEINNNLGDFKNEETKNITEYFGEIIDEKVENGMSEEEAVASLGDVKNIINNIKADLVIKRSSNKKTNSLGNFIIILGICSSPILIPIGIAFFVVFISLFIALVSVFFAFGVSSIAVFFGSIVTAIGMLVTNVNISVVFIFLGVSFIVSAILFTLDIFVFYIGRVILNFINRLFGKLIKNKTKKEEL